MQLGAHPPQRTVSCRREDVACHVGNDAQPKVCETGMPVIIDKDIGLGNTTMKVSSRISQITHPAKIAMNEVFGM